MPWVSADSLECDCGPCTRQCGTQEYDESHEKRNYGNGPGMKKPLDPDKLYDLYHKENMSLRQIAKDSMIYFGIKVSDMHVQREMIKYGIPRRGRGHGVKSSNFILDPDTGI